MGALRVQFYGAHGVSRAFVRASEATEPELRRAMRETGEIAVRIFRGRAPFRTGRLRRGIVSLFRGSEVRVEAHARNPESGFDYVRITRFGHRRARITPVHGQALRFTVGGRVLIRRSVKGYHPHSDWAEGALPVIAVAARGALTRAGQRIKAAA